MLVKTYCAAVNGLEVTTVTIEVSMNPGVMYRFTGLGDTAVREAAVVNNLEVYGMESLQDVMNFLSGRQQFGPQSIVSC